MEEHKTKPMAIAVVGVGAIFPGAPNAPEFWKEIVAGKDLITEVPPSHWMINDYYDKDPKAEDKTYCRRGSFLPDIEFDPLEWGIPPQIIPCTDTSQLLSLIVAKEVLNDTYQGNFFGVDLSRASIILGVTASQELAMSMSGRLFRPIWIKAMREYGLPEAQINLICDRISQHMPRWQENTFPGLLMNVVAGRVANRLNFGGTNCITDAACASSFSALSMGINELQLHQADLAVIGGVDTLNDIFAFMCFSKTPALSPTEDCRPFSSKSDGTLLAEGVGLFALKRLEDAEKEGNKIYAVIRGIGTSSDGRAKSIYAPLAKGQAVAVQRAYDAAGYSPRTVELFEAHGTGTKAGDIEEFQGMKEVFEEADKDHKQWCALGTIKSQIGHAKGAAGAAGLFKIVMALHHKVLPPTLKVDMPNPELHIENSPFYLNTKTKPWIKDAKEPRRASVSSFGFGGTNFHIAVEEYKGPGKKPSRFNSSSKHLILFSASTAEALSQRCKEIKNETAKMGGQFIPYCARQSYQSFHAEDPFRLAVIVEDETDFHQKLSKAIEYVEKNAQQQLVEKDIYFSSGAKTGKVAFLFSGQGSQYIGMGADLAMFFDASRKSWDLATQNSFDSLLLLHEVVFPKSVFSDEEKSQQQTLLNDTIWTQPALGAVAFSQVALLNDLGLTPDCVTGHSFGELAALSYAGAFDYPTLLKIARKRGELMADSSSYEKGGMLAIFNQPIDQTLMLLEKWQLSLVPASINSPSEIVLSGPLDELEKAKNLCSDNKISFKQLPVSNAFHSPLMKTAALSFRTFLANLHIDNLKLPVYSNSTVLPYPQEENTIKDMIAEQLEKPVRFVDTIKAMYASGVRVFLEVGPHAVLTNLVKAILNGEEFQAIALDNKNENGLTSFWRALGQLAVQGIPLNFEQLLADYAVPPVPETVESKKHKILINGANVKTQVAPLEQGKAAAQWESNLAEIQQSKVEVSPPPANTPPANITPSSYSEKPNPSLLQTKENRNTSSLITLYEQIQKDVAQAHEQYQQSAAGSHKAFLHLVEQTLDTLHQATPGAGVEMKSDVLDSSSKIQPSTLKPRQEDSSLTTQPLPAIKPETKIPDANFPLPAIEKESQKTDLTSAILLIISAETGYPVEMLSMQMEMEADLGIDSIKRVEILSAIQEKFPELPELDPVQLASLKTLQQLDDYTKQFLTASNLREASPSGTQIPSQAKIKPSVNEQDMHSNILAIIAAETGYPIEMLSMQMDMEADLGIDSIKRVEILSAIQEKFPELPELDPVQLASLKTLQQLDDYTKQFLTASTPSYNQRSPLTEANPNIDEQDMNSDILAIIAAETGYPIEMLSMQMDMEADLGIDSIKRVEILSAIQEKYSELPELDPVRLAKLKTLQQLKDFVSNMSPEQVPPTPENNRTLQNKQDYRLGQRQLVKPLIGNELPGLKKGLTVVVKDKQGISRLLVENLRNKGLNAEEVDNLSTLSDEIDCVIYLGGLSEFVSQSDAIQINIEAFEVAKSIAKKFSSSGGSLVLVQNTGGDFGLSTANLIQAWSSGLVALARTATLEWKDAFVKAIDLDCENQTAETIAERLSQELLLGGSEKEIGLRRDGKRLVFEDEPLRYEAEEPLNLAEKSVVLVSGGARGVTAWCVEALASRYRLHFILLGRTILEDEPDYCKTAHTAAELKQKLFEHAKSQNITLPPKELEQQALTILANREIHQTLQSLKAKQSEATYYSVDILNNERVKEIVAEVEAKYGKIKGLIHGAGLIQDKLIEQKTKKQFEEVFYPKVKGLSILLDALASQPLQLICFFSSVAARYGNQGQCDYAMANQILNTIAEVEQKRRGKDCLVKSINWGPWEGGMVTPDLQKHFHSLGVKLLSRALGTELFLTELAQKKPVSILLGSGWGAASTTVDNSAKVIKEIFTISPTSHSFLLSHCIKGSTVVPVCLVFEWLVRAIHKHYPNINKVNYHNLKVIHGLRMEPFDERSFTALLKPRLNNEHQEILLELKEKDTVLSYSMTAKENLEPKKISNLPSIIIEKETTGWPWKIEDCYGDATKLFHGPDFYLVKSLTAYGEHTASAVLRGISDLKWPAEEWLTDPGLVDGAFQVASLFGWRFFKKISIPMKIEEISLHQQGLIKEPVICLLQLRSHDSYCATYNLLIMHSDARPIMEINGLEMVVMP